jgi:hypothetical protein
VDYTIKILRNFHLNAKESWTWREARRRAGTRWVSFMVRWWWGDGEVMVKTVWKQKQTICGNVVLRHTYIGQCLKPTIVALVSTGSHYMDFWCLNFSRFKWDEKNVNSNLKQINFGLQRSFMESVRFCISNFINRRAWV